MFKLIKNISLLMCLFSYTVNASEFRITVDELKKISASEDIVILDVRNINDYEVGHIENAISFPVNLTYLKKKTNGKIQKPARMQTFLRERGIDVNSNVVIYDDGIMVDAARMFWTLEVYGLTKVRVLDQGFKFWRSKNLTSSQSYPNIKPSHYVTKIKHDRLASKFATQLATQNKNKIIIDARSYPAYIGKTSIAKRFGHIPNAVNLPFTHNITKKAGFSGLKSLAALKEVYSNVPKDKKVIIYCKIGRVSSTNYFALRELGHDVANYDASWKEWGNDDALPIEK